MNKIPPSNLLQQHCNQQITAKQTSSIRFFNPLYLALNLWRHRELIIQFTKREIEGRYKGSFLGLLWSLVNPLVMLSIYTFVFGIVLKSRWHTGQVYSLGQFALVLFCGLIVLNIFSECISRAPNLILSVPNYVKKVVFPLEVLAICVLGSALFHASASLLVLLIGNLLAWGKISWTIILLPIITIPLIFLILGLSWFLAGLGVFIRDINQTVALIVQLFFFVTPIFYPLDIIPEPYRTIISFNPLTSIVENYRRLILWGTQPNWMELIYWTCFSFMALIFGFAWFMKTKRGFADVI